tara:strand:- start:295 stop:711 length:417 start_codon:yes stop_codon:yes gene_type:complete
MRTIAKTLLVAFVLAQSTIGYAGPSHDKNHISTNHGEHVAKDGICIPGGKCPFADKMKEMQGGMGGMMRDMEMMKGDMGNMMKMMDTPEMKEHMRKMHGDMKQMHEYMRKMQHNMKKMKSMMSNKGSDKDSNDHNHKH